MGSTNLIWLFSPHPVRLHSLDCTAHCDYNDTWDGHCRSSPVLVRAHGSGILYLEHQICHPLHSGESDCSRIPGGTCPLLGWSCCQSNFFSMIWQLSTWQHSHISTPACTLVNTPGWRWLHWMCRCVPHSWCRWTATDGTWQVYAWLWMRIDEINDWPFFWSFRCSISCLKEFELSTGICALNYQRCPRRSQFSVEAARLNVQPNTPVVLVAK